MCAMSYIEIFMEIFNVCAATLVVLISGLVIFNMQRLNRDLLKARIFLNDAIIQQTWTYISIAGAAFALNAVIKFMVLFTRTGEILNKYYMVEITQVIFLFAFIHAIYSYFVFISKHSPKVI